ncbi:class I SAM-dependent methyltransferase [Parabacteroides provencensis]|uniref:class I SAM-dependent methyltransferase n=1 Tax=Parabacteroides provencensis TaxID=1944636 RepID=UPI000C150F42|nr:class I SAM-dependent methyltransferase [Parabacteroides provencensis]
MKKNKLSDVDYITSYFLHPILFKCFEKYAKGYLLDIGCGSKPYLCNLEKYVDTYYGCDFVQSKENNVDLVCDAIDIPLENESFDTIISTQVLEHVFDTKKCISESFRLLKPNGVYIISVPLVWPIHLAPYDFHRFTKYGIKNYLEEAGFRDIEIYSNGGKWAMIGQMINLGLFFPVPRKPFLNIIKKWFLYLSNKFFVFMDKKYFNDNYTLNYVVVCKK